MSLKEKALTWATIDLRLEAEEKQRKEAEREANK